MAGGLPWSCSRSRFLFFGGPHTLEDFALGEPLREAHLVQPYALLSSFAWRRSRCLLGGAHDGVEGSLIDVLRGVAAAALLELAIEGAQVVARAE